MSSIKPDELPDYGLTNKEMADDHIGRKRNSQQCRIEP